MTADDTSRDDMGDPIKHCERCGREVYYGSRCPQPCAERDTSREALIERLRVAMLGTTDGDFIDPESDVPAGEMFRLAAEWVDAVVMPLVQGRDMLNRIANGYRDECVAVIRRAEAAEAALHAARATRDVFVKAAVHGHPGYPADGDCTGCRAEGV